MRSPRAENLEINPANSESRNVVSCLSDWEPLVPLSRRRLQQRVQGWRVDRTPAKARTAEGSTGRSSRVQAAIESAEQQQTPSRSVKSASSLAGALASLVVHLLLIGVLGWITLKAKDPPAAMVFHGVAAEADPAQAVELVQPLTAEAPDVVEPSPQIDSNIDLSDYVPQLEAATLISSPSAAVASSFAGATELAASAMSGTPGASSFFGAAAAGNNFCYVLDASGSMRGGPWEAARFELLRSLTNLHAKQRFYIVVFTRELKAIPVPGGLEPASHHLYATPGNIEHARRWLLTLQVGGGGASPKEALKFAISKEPDAIYLLTDGVTSVRDVAAFVRNENRVTDLIHGEQIRSPIHTIAFYSSEGQQLLRQLAAENGGQFIYVPGPAAAK